MIKILEYDLKTVPKVAFDEFVQKSNNGTIFSQASFYKYHDQEKPVRFYVFTEKGEWLAVCVGAKLENQFKSPFAASYGGLIYKTDLRFEKQEALLLAFKTYLINQGINEIYFVLAPLCYSKEIDQYLDYLLKYNGFIEDQTLISSVIDLRVFDGQTTFYKANQQVEKARKAGIQVREIQPNELDDFYSILLENKAKFNMKPTHSLSELKRLFQLFPDKMLCYGAFLEDKMIAGALNFVATSKTVLAFYIATDYAFSKWSPTNLLIQSFIEDAKEKGFIYLDLGVSMETDTKNPMDPRRSLIYFKEHFSARGQVRSRFVWKDDLEK